MFSFYNRYVWRRPLQKSVESGGSGLCGVAEVRHSNVLCCNVQLEVRLQFNTALCASGAMRVACLTALRRTYLFVLYIEGNGL